MHNIETSISEYIENEQRLFSLYVLQSRSLPHAADGLKAAARRILWTARDNKKYKTATLAGACMPIHPHASPDSTINTITAPYGNNIPLLDGEGAFGTLLTPNAFGASRYTSVKTSDFTKDVIFKDMSLVPMQENYDGTLQEPVHFLPLVPIVLLNPQEGIAVGFASSILPRSLDTIIQAQIDFLTKGKFKTPLPHMVPLQQRATESKTTTTGSVKYKFQGSYEKVNATTVRITNLPYGITHEKYIDKLTKLEENEEIQDYVDNSRDCYSIEIRFKKGKLNSMSDQSVISLLGLENWVSENMNVISFDGETVSGTSFNELIEQFSVWRLAFYKDRYVRLRTLIQQDIQKYKDIITAIEKNVGGLAKKIKSRSELKEVLTELKIVNIDYIADMSIYKFTEEEKRQVEQKLAEDLTLLEYYEKLIDSEDERRKIYVDELRKILHNYKKGKYTH